LRIEIGTKAAPAAGMSNNAFDRALTQIVAEAEVQSQAEQHAQARRQTLAKVRRVASYLVLTTLLACGFLYRQELRTLVAPMFDKALASNTTPQVGDKTGAALKGIEASAAKRDAAMEDILRQPSKK
jgi:hypothetical protein